MSSSSGGAEPFAALHDVPCHVEVILGTRTISVRECLEMTPGMVLSINQPAGADIAIQINGIGIATGEVLVVDDHTSVRVTDILPSLRGDLR